MSTRQTQQEYLQAAKEELALDWATFAARAGVTARAMKNYRKPTESAEFRLLPPLARSNIDELLEAERRNTQQKFLRSAKAILGLRWDDLAAAARIHPRALKTYRLPASSKDYRTMPSLARRSIERLVAAAQG